MTFNTSIIKSLTGYLRLMRPPNVITAFADVITGIVISLGGWPQTMDLAICLLLSTGCLYAGNIIFNDIFDRKIDALERPERPIPAGIVSPGNAAAAGISLIIAGSISAAFVSMQSLILALAISILAFTYNGLFKKFMILGPINMAMCRGLNLLLGLSISYSGFMEFRPLAFIPFFYIAGVTLVSKGEVHGGERRVLAIALFLYILAIMYLLSLHYFAGYNILKATVFLALFIYSAFKPLIKAIKTLKAEDLRYAVKMGVLSLVILDAAMASGFTDWTYGAVIVGLLPVSYMIARIFEVT